MKIALFGGSFDPPHLGHEKIVEAVLANFEIDKLIIMPAFLSMNKKSHIADAKTRLRWAQTLWGDTPRVKVCDFEIKRALKTPTLTSVKFLLKELNADKISVIIGSDNSKSLDKWEGIEELKSLADFIISKRPGSPCKKGELDLNLDISSKMIREKKNFKLVNAKIRQEVEKIYK